MTADQQQPHLWQDVQSNLVFADLCNALYERELKKLSTECDQPQPILLKRIGSLPFYIKRASERIIAIATPLDLDSQNASWLYRQSKQCPGPSQTAGDIDHFYHKYAKLGLVVPVYHLKLGEELITLDTIDGIDKDQTRIHTNENGWFYLNGLPGEGNSHQSQLLKPTKLSMSGACSGHKWLNNKRTYSRALSLREMLLATNINWKNFGATL
jgi:hypothetical protein